MFRINIFRYSEMLTKYSLEIFNDLIIGKCLKMAILLFCLTAIKPNNVAAQHCPTFLSQWEDRSSVFQCKEPSSYHCVLTSNDSLKEICMISELVAEDEGGCPWIKFVKNEAFFGHPKIFCNRSDCPGTVHRGYRTDMLYLYPGCFKGKKAMTKYSFTSANSTARERIPFDGKMIGKSSSDLLVALICVSLLLIASLSALVMIRYFRLRQQRGQIIETNEIPKLEKRFWHNEQVVKYEFHKTAVCERRHLIRVPLDEEKQVLLPNIDDAWNDKGFIKTEAMTKITQLLSKERKILLYGICGSGKTYAALWYGQQCKKHSKDSIVCEIECENLEKMLVSLKDLCTDLKKLPLKDIESKDTEIQVRSYANLIVQCLMSLHGEHIFIFEDLTDSMVPIGVKIMKSLLKQPNVKCIITTQDRNLFKEYDVLPEENIIEFTSFSDQEAVSFLGTEFGREEDLKQLANALFHLPLALMSVKSYMKCCKTKASVMLSYLNAENRYCSNPKSSGIDLSVFKPLNSIVGIIRKETSSIYDLMLFLQFMDPHEIPVYLFNFLQHPSWADEAERTTNVLIKTIEQFSFGKVHGSYEFQYEDERKLIIKPIIPLVMKGMSSREEMRPLLLTFLKGCSWVLCKDQGHKVDRERCVNILPHARKALSLIDKYFQKNRSVVEVLSTIMVAESVRFSLQHIGQIRESESISNYTLDICYEFLETSYEKLTEELILPFSEDKLLNISLELADKIATIVNGKIGSRDEDDLEKYAKDYILHKHRLVHERDMLNEILNADLKHGVQLSEEELLELRKQGYAIQSGKLGRFFIFEAIILAFLSYGLRVLRTSVTTETKKKMLHHVFVAYHLSQRLKEAFKPFEPYCALECDLNGRIELLMLEIIDENEGVEDRLESLQKVEKELHEILEQRLEKKYFLSGICIRKTSDWNHKLNCEMKLLQCCKEIIKTSTDQGSRISLLITEQEYADQLEECLKQIIEDEKLNSAYKSQEAKQVLVSHHLSNHDYEKARYLLEKMKHLDHENPKASVTPMDLHDLILLSKCYKKTENHEALTKIRGSLESLQDKINKEYTDAFYVYKSLCSTLGYESSVGLTEMDIETDCSQ